MKRLKTFAIYILLIVAFFIFSRVIIFIGLNNTYDNISAKSTLPESITISSAKATIVNGEIKGKVSDTIDSKYIKFNFYTDIDTLAGTYYLTPSELENKDFEFYFKLNNVETYDIELTNEKQDDINLKDFSLEPFEGYVLISLLVLAMFI